MGVSGPLFDGRAKDALHRYSEDLKMKLAQDVRDQIISHLHYVIKVDFHIYESFIHTERQLDDIIVTDTPVVYGPWLEGVGSQDFPVTRFRGYHTFRYIANRFQAEVEPLADTHLQPYLREMN
jgi:hypothetical protein